MKKRSIACMCPTGGTSVVANPQEINPGAVRAFFERNALNTVFIMSAGMYERMNKSSLLENSFNEAEKIVISPKGISLAEDGENTTTFPSLWGALEFAEDTNKKEIIFIGEWEFLQMVVNTVSVQEVRRFYLRGKPGPEVKTSTKPLLFKENKDNWEDREIPYKPTPEDNYSGFVSISTHRPN